MREQLAALDGQRLRFVGIFGRFGCRPVFAGLHVQTMLLERVATADGAPVADHLWLVVTSRFAALDLRPGDALAFDARVRPYQKQRLYRRHGGRLVKLSSRTDYGLAYPTRVEHRPAMRAERIAP